MAENGKVTPWEDYDYNAKLPDFWEVTGAALGLGLCQIYRSSNIRPLTTRASVMMMSGYMVGGYLIGKAATVFRNNMQLKKALFVDDYVKRHPEDFATSEPKKFKDVLWEWTPHR